MADVSFNEEPQYQNSAAPSRSLFMKLAYATGIPKSDTQAQYVLLGVAGVIFVGAVWLFIGALGTGRASVETLTPDQLREKNGYPAPVISPQNSYE